MFFSTNRKLLLIACLCSMRDNGIRFSLGLSGPYANQQASRRAALGGWLSSAATVLVATTAFPESGWTAPMDVEDFLKTGMVSMPMGVSGQAGKSRPETGIVLRDGTELARDPRNGDVSAEILLKSPTNEYVPILTSFSSPWPLATGTLFDVECRDASTGDGAFLLVSPNVKGKSISELSKTFFAETIFSPTGRFSFYGQPTDIKVSAAKDSTLNDNYRVLDISFSTLSQSTNAEIPRKARVAAVIPEGTTQVLMLVSSASANRWKKGSDKLIASTIDSFRAVRAPSSSLKIRAKDRSGGTSIDENN